jgi:hypothetical protein
MTPSFMNPFLSIDFNSSYGSSKESLMVSSQREYGLCDLAQKLGINGLRLWVVIVVPENYQVECLVEKMMYDNLGLEMYYIEINESKLYDN